MFSRSTRLASASRTRPLRAFAARHNATQAVADILPAAPSSSAPPRQPDTTPAPEDTPTQGDPSGPQPTRDAKPRRPTKALEPRKPEKSRSVFVSPGRPIRDILEALALLRGVEKELGPAQEFKFPRDSELATDYGPWFAVTFRDPGAWEQVPEEGITVRVAVPSPKHSQHGGAETIMSGGYGLEDLRPLLTPAERVSQRPLANRNAVDVPLEDGEVDSQLVEARKNGMEIVEVKIERAQRPFMYRPRIEQYPMSSAVEAQAGAALVRWGGFAPTHVTAEDGTLVPAPPTEMQQAIARWRRTLGDDAYDAAVKVRKSAGDAADQRRANRERREAEAADGAHSALAALRAAQEAGTRQAVEMDSGSTELVVEHQEAEVPAVVANEEEIAAERRARAAQDAAERERKALTAAWANFSFSGAAAGGSAATARASRGTSPVGSGARTAPPAAPMTQEERDRLAIQAEEDRQWTVAERARQAILAEREKRLKAEATRKAAPTPAAMPKAAPAAAPVKQKAAAASATAKPAPASAAPVQANATSTPKQSAKQAKAPAAKAPAPTPSASTPESDAAGPRPASGLFSKITGIFGR